MDKPGEVVSWADLEAAIGRRSVEFITRADLIDRAHQVINSILDQGYGVGSDGRRVYTNYPFEPDMRQVWQEMQPALLRAFMGIPI